MRNASDQPDPLLHALLREVDEEDLSGAAQHPPAEALAQFAAAELEADEHAQLVDHLADCSLCRETVGWLLKDNAAGLEQNVRPARWFAPQHMALVTAAAVLIATGITFMVYRGQARWKEPQVYAQGRALLEAGQFAQVSELVADAARRGVVSNRLHNLNAVALLAFPERWPWPIVVD